MKTALGIIIIVILLGGGWYFYNQSNTAGSQYADAMMEENHESDTMMEEDGAMMEKDGGAMMEEGVNSVSFDVTGNNFAFSQTEIRVKKGDKVTINFTSTGGFHDWVVDQFFAATDRVNEGGSSSVTFVADETGSFEYYCSVGNHRAQGMVGTLIVE